jgi:hypothetical protein
MEINRPPPDSGLGAHLYGREPLHKLQPKRGGVLGCQRSDAPLKGWLGRKREPVERQAGWDDGEVGGVGDERVDGDGEERLSSVGVEGWS